MRKDLENLLFCERFVYELAMEWNGSFSERFSLMGCEWYG
jgi:hypothetical protein